VWSMSEQCVARGSSVSDKVLKEQPFLFPTGA
jgi:hypothetical protein